MIVLFTHGAYSGYDVIGLADAPSEEWCAAKLAEWLEANPKQREPYGFDSDGFAEWLLAMPEVRRLEFKECWLGSYGDPPKSMFDSGLYDANT